MSIFFISCTTPKTKPLQIQKQLIAIDLYGSDRVTVNEIKNFLQGKIEMCTDFFFVGQHDNFKKCKNEISTMVQSNFNFASVEFSLIQYYQPTSQNIYITFDVVEPEDTKERLNFIKRPNKEFDDPDGLINAWIDYQRIGFELLGRNEITAERGNCPAFHCIFGHEHPALKPFEKKFLEGVQKNQKQLEEMFLFDKNDNHRGTSVYLLAYGKDGKKLVKLLSERLNDESSYVRNNVMRVFSDLSNFNPEFDLPINKIINALNFPATTDRNKACAILLGMSKNKIILKKHYKIFISKVVPIALKMLRLDQPNNHVLAYSLLQEISKKNFSENDYLKWNDWYQHERSSF